MTWFILGAALGGLSAWMQRWTVARLCPSAPRRALAWTLGGATLRWALMASLLIGALQQGLVPGLLVCAGLSSARWGLVWRWSVGRLPFDPVDL